MSQVAELGLDPGLLVSRLLLLLRNHLPKMVSLSGKSHCLAQTPSMAP